MKRHPETEVVSWNETEFVATSVRQTETYLVKTRESIMLNHIWECCFYTFPLTWKPPDIIQSQVWTLLLYCYRTGYWRFFTSVYNRIMNWSTNYFFIEIISILQSWLVPHMHNILCGWFLVLLHALSALER